VLTLLETSKQAVTCSSSTLSAQKPGPAGRKSCSHPWSRRWSHALETARWRRG